MYNICYKIIAVEETGIAYTSEMAKNGSKLEEKDKHCIEEQLAIYLTETDNVKSYFAKVDIGEVIAARVFVSACVSV